MFSLIINEAGILQKKILQHTGLFTMNILNYIKQTLFKHKEKEYFDTDYLLQFFDGEKTDDKGRYITDYMKFVPTNGTNARFCTMSFPHFKGKYVRYRSAFVRSRFCQSFSRKKKEKKALIWEEALEYWKKNNANDKNCK